MEVLISEDLPRWVTSDSDLDSFYQKFGRYTASAKKIELGGVIINELHVGSFRYENKGVYAPVCIVINCDTIRMWYIATSTSSSVYIPNSSNNNSDCDNWDLYFGDSSSLYRYKHILENEIRKLYNQVSAYINDHFSGEHVDYLDLVEEPTFPNNYSPYELTESQCQGVNFLLNGGHILGFQTGLGKTCTALTAAIMWAEKNNGKFIIVSPASAISQWNRHFNDFNLAWYDSYNLPVSQGVVTTDCAIVSIRQFNKFRQIIELYKSQGFNVLTIFDEVHIFKGETTLDADGKPTKGGTRHYFYEYTEDLRWGLSATPFSNNVLDIIRTLDFVDHNCFDQPVDQYIKYYQRRIKTTSISKGARVNKKEEEIYSIFTDTPLLLTKEFFKVFDREVIVKSNPYNVIYHSNFVDFTEEESNSIYTAFERFKIDLKGAKSLLSRYLCTDDILPYFEPIEYPNLRDNTGQWKPISEAIKEYPLTGFTSLNHICSYLEAKTQSKQTALLKLVKNIVSDNGRGLIIYCNFKDSVDIVYNCLEEHQNSLGINNIYRFTGDEASKKDSRSNLSNNLKPKDVLVMSKAGSESIDLNSVNNLIFFEIPLSIVTVMQTIGRITRHTNSISTQHVGFLVGKGTINHYLFYTCAASSTMFEQVMGSQTTIPTEFTNLGLSYLLFSLVPKSRKEFVIGSFLNKDNTILDECTFTYNDKKFTDVEVVSLIDSYKNVYSTLKAKLSNDPQKLALLKEKLLANYPELKANYNQFSLFESYMEG